MIDPFSLSIGDARALLAGGAPVYVPVNPVEYHGPHLSLHNDRLLAQGLIRLIHERFQAVHPDWPLLCVPDLEVGVDTCPGPGTQRTSFEVTRGRVLETCRTLATLGAKRVILATFHGAPLHNLALEAGVQVLRAQGIAAVAPMHGMITLLLDASDPGLDVCFDVVEPEARAALRAAFADDFHAGFLETSLSLYLAPESVSPSYRALPPCPAVRPAVLPRLFSRLARGAGARKLALELDFIARGLGWFALRPFPAYTQSPHLATAAFGEAIATYFLERLVPELLAILEGQRAPYAPILAWTGPASLWGRIGVGF